MAKKVLTLSTIADQEDRPFIEVDGKQYTLQASSDLGLIEQTRILALSKYVEKLIDKIGTNPPSETDAKYLEARLDDCVHIVVPTMPKDVMTKLRSPQKTQILDAFNSAAATRRKQSQSEKETAPAQEKMPAS